MIRIREKYVPTRIAILSSTLPTRTWNLLISLALRFLDGGYAHHAANNVRPRSLLVDQGECGIQVVGNGCGTRTMSAERTLASVKVYSPLGATSVRRNNDAVLRLEILPDVAEEGRLGVQVVHYEELERKMLWHEVRYLTWYAEEAW
jgi:hypothetical protein